MTKSSVQTCEDLISKPTSPSDTQRELAGPPLCTFSGATEVWPGGSGLPIAAGAGVDFAAPPMDGPTQTVDRESFWVPGKPAGREACAAGRGTFTEQDGYRAIYILSRRPYPLLSSRQTSKQNAFASQRAP